MAGQRAQVKGSGTINGTGSYGFLLTAVDGSNDTFRIKIWDKSSNAVVYDNQVGGADDAEPTTTLGGGQIVIHRG